MGDFIHKNIRNYIEQRWDIPDDIKDTVTTDAIDAYMRKAEPNPEDFADKSLREIVDEIKSEIQNNYPEITQNTSDAAATAAAGGSRRRRRRHRRSTRTSTKGKKYSTTRRRK